MVKVNRSSFLRFKEIGMCGEWQKVIGNSDLCGVNKFKGWPELRDK